MSRKRKAIHSQSRMRPSDIKEAGWADHYSFEAWLAPTRKPPAKRSRRERVRDRSMRLARRLKREAVDGA